MTQSVLKCSDAQLLNHDWLSAVPWGFSLSTHIFIFFASSAQTFYMNLFNDEILNASKGFHVHFFHYSDMHAFKRRLFSFNRFVLVINAWKNVRFVSKTRFLCLPATERNIVDIKFMKRHSTQRSLMILHWPFTSALIMHYNLQASFVRRQLNYRRKFQRRLAQLIYNKTLWICKKYAPLSWA